MDFKSVDEIIKFALGTEIEAVEFYTSLAKDAHNESIQKIFESFAKEEEKHVKLLTEMGDNKERIDSYEFERIPDLKISDYMVDIDYKEGMPMPEILKIAMKREEKAVKLYSLMADQTNKEDVKKIFNILVQEESKHKFALESLYDDYLADQEG